MNKKTQIYKNNKLVYDGFIENNKFNGYGKLYYDNGNLNCEAIWKDGEIVKTYKKYYQDGKLLYQSYNHIDDNILYDNEIKINDIKDTEFDNSIILETNTTNNYTDLLNEDIDEMFNDLEYNYDLDEDLFVDNNIDLEEPLLENNFEKKVNNDEMIFLKYIKRFCNFMKEKIYNCFKISIIN